MTQDEIKEFIKAMPDDELMERIEQAYEDCAQAAETEAESEWHIACFAGLMACVFEARDRGLHIKRMH